MQWLTRYFQRRKNRAQREADLALQRIRFGMLNTMDAHCEKPPIRLDAAIQRADDVVALWNLRQDLMNAIAASKGKDASQKAMDTITELFRGHISSVKR